MDTMQHNGLEFTSLQDLDSPRSNFFWDHPTGSSPAASKSSVNQAMKHSLTGPLFSQSPESSSASDFSNNQHKRHHSSDSSRSGALAPEGDIQMANAGILIGTDPENQSSDESSPVTDVDLSNRAMECHFVSTLTELYILNCYCSLDH